MKRITRVFLYGLGGLVLLLVIAVLGINLYVESEGVQARLEAALSKELRMPVQLTRLRFSPWGGLRVVGLTVPHSSGDEREEEQGYFLDAPEIGARIALGPLFSRRLVIRELIIDSPKVVWRQTERGRWQLPEFTPEQYAPKAEAAPRPEATPSGPEAKKPAGKKKKLEFQIASARLQNASFRFLDRKGNPLAVFEGVTLNCPVATRHEARGSAMIQRVTLHDRVVIRNMVAPFEYVNGRLALPQFDAQLAQGTITGSYFLYPELRNAPFSLDLRMERVDLHQLFEEIGADESVQRSQGKLNGYFGLHGLTGEARSLAGAGQVILVDGRMEQYPLLQSIGSALKIDELTRLELKDAQLDFWIGEGKVNVEDFRLESTNLRIHAGGEGHFDGKLRLDARLAVNRKISRQLPGWVDSNFRPVEGDGELREIRFHISGTLEEPSTDLMRVMVGEKLEEQAIKLFKTFQSITNGDRKKKRRDREPEETETRGTPER